MTKLAEAVDWTRRIGYLYPREVFEPALKATIKDLSPLHVEHCVAEHERVQIAWNQRVEATEFFGLVDAERGRT